MAKTSENLILSFADEIFRDNAASTSTIRTGNSGDDSALAISLLFAPDVGKIEHDASPMTKENSTPTEKAPAFKLIELIYEFKFTKLKTKIFK